MIGVSDAKTKILPGHGVLSDVGEVRVVRDMMLVIRDRVKERVDAGDTLQQVQTAGLTASTGKIGAGLMQKKFWSLL